EAPSAFSSGSSEAWSRARKSHASTKHGSTRTAAFASETARSHSSKARASFARSKWARAQSGSRKRTRPKARRAEQRARAGVVVLPPVSRRQAGEREREVRVRGERRLEGRAAAQRRGEAEVREAAQRCGEARVRAAEMLDRLLAVADRELDASVLDAVRVPHALRLERIERLLQALGAESGHARGQVAEGERVPGVALDLVGEVLRIA